MKCSLAACVLLWSTIFLGVDAGVPTCKDRFYDSSTETYRSCKECLQSLQCAEICCKTSITVEPKSAGKDNRSDNKEEKTISKTRETAETGVMRPNVAVVLLLSFFALLILLVLGLVLFKSMRDRALENRSNRADRCEGSADIQEVLRVSANSTEQDAAAVHEDTTVCGCQVKVTTHPDLALGSQTSLPQQNSLSPV